GAASTRSSTRPNSRSFRQGRRSPPDSTRPNPRKRNRTMSDVRDAVAPALDETVEPRGDFIWYELLTTDIAGAKRFYDAVVGWNVQDRSDFPNDYRMIGRSDGKFAGGAMQITDDMRQHGARPIWLGYILVPDV